MNYNKAELCKDCKMPVSKEMLRIRIPEVAHLTDINYHTEARLLIATAMRDTALMNAYGRIKREQDRVGHLPRALSNQRNQLDRKLYRKLKLYDNAAEVWSGL